MLLRVQMYLLVFQLKVPYKRNGRNNESRSDYFCNGESKSGNTCQMMAKAAGAIVVGTGRSDFPNQVNNVFAFPGIFRGALDVRATHINEKMKVAAVEAIAGLIKMKMT